MPVAEVLRCPVCGCERHFGPDMSRESEPGGSRSRPAATAAGLIRTRQQADRDYWTARFTPEEIYDLAKAIWT